MLEYYQHLVYIQLILEIVLLALLVLIWRRPKGPKTAGPENLQVLMKSWPHLIKETEEASLNFQKNLQEKRELSAGLIAELDLRLKECQRLLNELDTKIAQAQRPAPLNPAVTFYRESGQANPAAPETRAMVLKLAQKGLSMAEIAVQTNLHQGEVELIIDLEKQLDFGV